LERRVLKQLESGQWFCRTCRSQLRKAGEDYYAKPRTIERLREFGFDVPDNLSNSEGERLLALAALRVEGEQAPFDTPLEELERRLGVAVLRRRHIKVSPDASLEEVNELLERRGIRHYHSKVVGVTFENDDGTIRQDIIAGCELFEKLRLEYDENHPEYPNAIRVHRESGEKLGHLGSELATEVMEKIKQGYAFMVFIKNLTGGVEGAENLGVNVLIVEAEPGVSAADAQAYIDRIDLSDSSCSW